MNKLNFLEYLVEYQSDSIELFESRKGLYNYLKQEFPSFPDYIVYDFLYQQAKTIDSQEQLEEWLYGIKKDYSHLRWTLKNIPITISSFNPETIRKFKERGMGQSNPYGVRNDEERNATQRDMIIKNGVSKEPIIVVKTNNGYELLEGWHRTMQHLNTFPQGYTGPAWIGE
jgi:hypothetical protein